MNEEFYQIVDKKKSEIAEELRQLNEYASIAPAQEHLQLEHKRNLLTQKMIYINQLYSYPLFVRVKQMTDNEIEEYRRLKLEEERGKTNNSEKRNEVSDDFPLLVQKLNEIIDKNIHYNEYNESHSTEEVRQTLINMITIMPHEYEVNYQNKDDSPDKIDAQFYEIIADDFMKCNKIQSLLYEYNRLRRTNPEEADKKETEIRAELGSEYENIPLPTRMELNEAQIIKLAAHAFYKRFVAEINQAAMTCMQKNEQKKELEEMLEDHEEKPEMGFSNMQ